MRLTARSNHTKAMIARILFVEVGKLVPRHPLAMELPVPRLNRHAAAAVAGWRSTPLGTYPAVSCSVCFVFDGGDKVRGKKVYKCP